jgi:NADH-quinone oxidoreductase subunit K
VSRFTAASGAGAADDPKPERQSHPMTPDAFPVEQLTSYLVLGAILMALGMLGFLARRNLILMFLSAEMMLQGVSLSLVAFGRYHGNWTGQVLTVMILTVAACEAGIALVLILVLYNRRRSLDVSLWQDLRDPGQPPVLDRPDEAEPLVPTAGPESYPHLTPAGREPEQTAAVRLDRRD